MLSTNADKSSNTATWITLIGSGLAFVVFFAWITKNLSVQVSPEQKSLLVQPSSKAGSASDNLEVSAEPLATNQNSQRKAEKQADPTAYSISSESKTTQASQPTLVETKVETRVEAKVEAKSHSAATKASRSLHTTANKTQRPADDLAALRQLVSEAAAINETKLQQDKVEQERRDKLESLEILCADLRFAPGSKVASESVTSTLDQIQQILAEFPETKVNVVVATNESGNEKADTRLSQERGRTLIAKLVNSGLALSRFSLKAITDQQLPANSHKVEIRAY